MNRFLYRRPRQWITSFLIGLISFSSVSAQNSRDSLTKLTAEIDTFRNNHPIEKLYLQFDKPYYAIGDTIWFKAYLFNAAYLNASAKSNLLYLELANDSGKVVNRIMLPVANGVSWGNIAINAKVIPEGSYTLHAYTNWMRNFGDDYVFSKRFYFGSPAENSWLVNTKIKLATENGVDRAHVTLQFNQLNRFPLVLKDMELDILDGKKTWYKSKIQTKVDGAVTVDFDLKSAARRIVLVAKDATAYTHKMVIPLTLNRADDVDLQFMPEGGNMVAGLPAHIGFKAIGSDGKGVNVAGDVYDSNQHLVASFSSAHKGMGAFNLAPVAGENYTAKITLAGGLVKTYNLPRVKNEGTVIKVRNVAGADSLVVTVLASQPGSRYYLIGQARGLVCYAAAFNMANNAAKLKVATMAFPTGIAHFTLLSANMQPLSERIIFINHNDNLQVEIKTDKPLYVARDSIALKVHVSDKNGNPVKGNFSIAITDDAQVKTDSTVAGNIISDLLLTSDLKGDVEQPGYYLGQDTDVNIKQQLDNLLLTQGWVGYEWRDMFAPAQKPFYPAEKEFAIRGSVLNAFNKPLVGNHVTVFSKKPFLLQDTVTDKEGHFAFKGMVPVDTPIYWVQARNKRGKSFNIGVEVDEFKSPAFTNPVGPVIPWYVNSDSTLMNYVKTNITANAEREKIPGGGRLLKEVVIKSKKIIKDSQNLNGPGNADVVIDEEELEKAGKKTFLQLLQEKVPGFKISFMLMSPPPSIQKVAENRLFAAFIIDDEAPSDIFDKDQYWYYVNSKPVKFIIDGIPLYKIMTMSSPAIVNINDYLNAHSAEDIKGIEVNSSAKYASRYVPVYWAAQGIKPTDITFIEITTRSGGGPGIDNTPGTYLYKPMPFSVPKQFYSPHYTVKNKDIIAKDYRSTIYWQPSLVTDKDGNATVSFYSADGKGNYTVILEGTSTDGALASKISTVKRD